MLMLMLMNVNLVYIRIHITYAMACSEEVTFRVAYSEEVPPHQNLYVKVLLERYFEMGATALATG